MKPTRIRFLHASEILHKSSSLTKSERLGAVGLSRLKPNLDIKHIVLNLDLYERSCLNRNHEKQSQYPRQIARLYEIRKRSRFNVVRLKAEIKEIEKKLHDRAGFLGTTSAEERKTTLAKARDLKQEVRQEMQVEDDTRKEIEELALQLPNTTSEFTPIGTEPRLLGYINAHLVPASVNRIESSPLTASGSGGHSSLDAPIQHQEELPRNQASSDSPTETRGTQTLSHVEIGKRLDILNFGASSQSSGWGFYYLQRDAALLEQALIQYAIHLCTSPPHSFMPVTPPSIVYTEIANAAGYMPRDASNERQTYTLKQSEDDIKRNKLEHTLAGTAEIPFAALHANASIPRTLMPKAVVGPSRCFRAEAGARGTDTKGLYRVHEFTKVEMFGWTLPEMGTSLDLFQTMLNLQKKFYESLGLRCRVLEMPSTDLGASAMRKIDIEAYFPGREKNKKGPWGEVSSLSLCGDYQTRRLQTVFADEDVSGEGMGKYPWTVNGTACAIPRVLAAILEAGWDSKKGVVNIPEVLWGWMGGTREIGPPQSKDSEAQVGQGGRASPASGKDSDYTGQHAVSGMARNGHKRTEGESGESEIEGFVREENVEEQARRKSG